VAVPGTIRAIAEADAGVAERVFGSSDAIVLGGWPGATKGQTWASYAQFADDVETESIPEDVRVATLPPSPRWQSAAAATCGLCAARRSSTECHKTAAQIDGPE